MRSGDQTNVDRAVAHFAYPTKSLLFQNLQQFRLDLQIDVAYLVKEDRTSMGYFKQAGLGPLIGTRTWGGLIGISGAPPLVDGGSVTVPTSRVPLRACAVR